MPIKEIKPRPNDAKILSDSLNQFKRALPDSVQVSNVTFSASDISSSFLVDNLLVGARLSTSKNPIIDPWAHAFDYIRTIDLLDLGINGILEDDEAQLRLHCNVSGYQSTDLTSSERQPRRFVSVSRPQQNILVLGPEARNSGLCERLLKLNQRVRMLNHPIGKIFGFGLAPENFDLVISNGYAWRVPEDFFKRVRGSVVNVHPSYLPWGKGIGTTLYTAIFAYPFGISIHYIDEEFDTGPILFRKLVTPSGSDTTRTYHNKAIAASTELLENSLHLFLNNSVPRAIEQKSLLEKSVHYTSRIHFERLIRFLPLGYDTKLATLSRIGRIVESNYSAIEQRIIQL